MNYILYYTMSGNTEEMANKLGELVENSVVSHISDFDSSVLTDEDFIFLGCAAYGAEQLSDEMLDFIEGLNYKWEGKKLGLFGSFDWGDGTWMFDWASKMEDEFGALVVGEGLKVNQADIDSGDDEPYTEYIEQFKNA